MEKILEKQIKADQTLLNSDSMIIGMRIPKDYFISSGSGESDITVHAGSYHLALHDAGIEMCNIMTYSSIMPAVATEIKKPDILTHGSVLETIMAVATTEYNKRATAVITFGWLYDKNNGNKWGGLVCEYNGSLEEDEAKNQLSLSLRELYENGYSDNYFIDDINVISKSIIPNKKYGTVLVSINFINYLIPIINKGE